MFPTGVTSKVAELSPQHDVTELSIRGALAEPTTYTSLGCIKMLKPTLQGVQVYFKSHLVMFQYAKYISYAL